MVWGGISWRGKTPLVIVDGVMNAEAYVNMLEDHCMPWMCDVYPRGDVFQQDGAPCHTAKHTMEYFMEMETMLLDWPAKSRDMNVVENAWGHLAREAANSTAWMT